MSAAVPAVEVVVPGGAELGEGPVWDSDRRRLTWVDITGGVLHLFDPTTGIDTPLPVGERVGCAVPRRSGGFLLALERGVAFFDPASRSVEPQWELDGDAPTWLNDGACDSRGRFWFGSAGAGGSEPLGSLYRLDPDLEVQPILDGVGCSNGIGWSPDDTAMYYVDSPTSRVDVFDYDLESGAATERRTLASFPREWGLPDGMKVAVDGSLWIAFWGGSSVRRFSPAGEPLASIELPTTLITSCAFGGPDLDDLYITSASIDLSAEERRSQPHAGALFRARPGVRGLPSTPFAG
jgi:sugar lactone lactonase YvrE